MTIELWMLLGASLLALAMPPIYGPGFVKALGMQTMLGNRSDMPAAEGWFSRAKRAHANLIENLLPFAAVVLIAQMAAVHSSWTRAGAVLFLVARLVHAAVYTAGIVPLRAPAWVAGLIGTLIVAFAVLFA